MEAESELEVGRRWGMGTYCLTVYWLHDIVHVINAIALI